MTKQALEVMNNSKTGQKFTKEEIADCFTLKDSDCDTKCKLGSSWPSYNGTESLEEHGSKDEVLRRVADTMSDTLSFVHICDEKEASASADENLPDPENNDESGDESGELEDGYGSSSDEEMEF